MNKDGLSFAYLTVVVLSIIFVLISFLVFTDLIQFNLDEDISRSLPLTLNLNNIAVEDVRDRKIDRHEDYFLITAILDEEGYEVPYEDIIVGFDFNGDFYHSNFGDEMNESTYVIQPINVQKQDQILRPLDRVIFKVSSPTTFLGGEKVTLQVMQKNSDSEMKIFLQIPHDLYGRHQILR